MENHEVIKIAKLHGLDLCDNLAYNEMGLDFQVIFAQEKTGLNWVLRLPRRTDLSKKISYEAQALRFVRKHLDFDVPNWKVVDEKFVAYPLLQDSPVITFDPHTHEIQWNINQQENNFTSSLASLLRNLHGVDVNDATEAGVRTTTIDDERKNLSDEIELVKREIGLDEKAEVRWRNWLDDDRYWPNFCVLVHGDLYAGHILAKSSGEITGVIDWSEIKIGDPSIDFSGHINVFGEQDLSKLISDYERIGGATWPMFHSHCIERNSIGTLKYAVFALEIESDQHIDAARKQLAKECSNG